MRSIGAANVSTFIEEIKPLVTEDIDALLAEAQANFKRDRPLIEQFQMMVDLARKSPQLRSLLDWQRVEIATMLVGYRASTGGVRVDYRSPSRYLMLLRRTAALEVGDFTMHASRQDIVDQAVSYGASETTARRLINDTKHAGLIDIVPCHHLCGLGCPLADGKCGSQKHFVTPTGSWMFSHAVKQLVSMLYRYSLYRFESSDPLAASTFSERWTRNFGFRQSTLDAAELVCAAWTTAPVSWSGQRRRSRLSN